MKTLLKLTAIAAIALTACQKAETTISVNLTDIPDGTIFQIIKWDGDGGKDVYTDTINGGTYSCTYKCDTIYESNSYSVTTIVGNMPYGHRRIYVTDDYSAIVTGSGVYSYDWNVDCKNPRQQFQNKLNDATKDISIEITKMNAARREPRITQDERRRLSEKMDSLNNKYYEAQLATFESMPVDELWIEELAKITGIINYEGTEHFTYPKFTELYKRLSDADKATPIGKRITLDLFGKAPDVGDKITDYDLYDANGNVHHLAEFQGKWMLIDFSTYYCGPCRMFCPAVKYFYEKGISNNIEIVTVTLDTKRQFEEMVATEKYVSPLWNDRDEKNGIFALYKIAAYPTFYAVKPDGTIVDSWMGLDLGKIVKTIKNAGFFTQPEYKTENGVTTITNPTFSDINGGLLIDKVAIYRDSVVLDCTYPAASRFSISSGTALCANDKKISKITKSDIGFDNFASFPVDEVGHCRLTFEPLPQGTTEFDFIEGDCDGCFRVTGIKVKE
ncbi:MAG: TlpA family protein disulfide reductase [Salinivirgaceae bacterium]|nr:TlpA family protein disulfide reductase [Salinivirgaceae bacterium]